MASEEQMITMEEECPKCGHPTKNHISNKCTYSIKEYNAGKDGFIRITYQMCTCDLSSEEVLVNLGLRIPEAPSKPTPQAMIEPCKEWQWLWFKGNDHKWETTWEEQMSWDMPILYHVKCAICGKEDTIG